jgi:CubicO group peptidase (beta-lactamase class C family)
MYGPAPVAEWRKPSDPRARITPDNLLRMTSGLDAPETGSGFDPASQMLYDSDDMGAFAANHQLSAPPGIHWAYTSVDTLILDRIMGHWFQTGSQLRHRSGCKAHECRDVAALRANIF